MDSHLRTLQKKRTANFREDETKLLIQLWGSPAIQNKLFLTHRKAPVMRLLAANMQQRGFYRTPDEIKTRIRNLKCLYHRIKRSLGCGTGIGTFDPDWPHFKAMDDILSKEYPRKETSRLMEEVLEGTPKFEEFQIKQEIDDIDIDDNDSWATNDTNSEYEEEPPPPPPPKLKPAPSATQAPTAIAPKKYVNVATNLTKASLQQQQPQQQKLPTILPAFSNANQLNLSNLVNAQNGAGNKMPFPLLILNSMPQQNLMDKNATGQSVSGNGLKNDSEVSSLLKELISVQKESLDVHKQKLEIETQRLEFDRLIGTQLVTLIPMLGGVLQRLAYPNIADTIDLKLDTESGIKRKRSPSEDTDILKDSKILKTMLEDGIKKYMMMDTDKDTSKSETNCKDSEKIETLNEKLDAELYTESDSEKEDKESDIEEDSGIHQDENSQSCDEK